MIGLAALSIAGFWAVKSHERYLRDFIVLYALFTLTLVFSMIVKYIALNIQSVPSEIGFILIGLRQIASFGVLVATIYMLLGLYKAKKEKLLTLVFVFFMVACAMATFSSFGIHFRPGEHIINLGLGYRLGAIGYLITFTYMILLGFAGLRRVWQNQTRTFVLGLMIFAAVGWIETLTGFLTNFQQVELRMTDNGKFLFSSIPYALYGIFLIWFFLNRFSLTPTSDFALSVTFCSKYGITKRESEIIQLIARGKSNADIARELFISLATVKTHLHNIYRKVGIDSRFDLLASLQSKKKL
jgi:DNA-binding CsgD family transcriptional regulator